MDTSGVPLGQADSGQQFVAQAGIPPTLSPAPSTGMPFSSTSPQLTSSQLPSPQPDLSRPPTTTTDSNPTSPLMRNQIQYMVQDGTQQQGFVQSGEMQPQFVMLPDGTHTQVFVQPDGTQYVVLPDGTQQPVVIQQDNSMQQQMIGQQMTGQPGGIQQDNVQQPMTGQPGGSSFVQQDVMQQQQAQPQLQQVLEDGTQVFVQPDGSQIHVKPDGTQILVPQQQPFAQGGQQFQSQPPPQSQQQPFAQGGQQFQSQPPPQSQQITNTPDPPRYTLSDTTTKETDVGDGGNQTAAADPTTGGFFSQPWFNKGRPTSKFWVILIILLVIVIAVAVGLAVGLKKKEDCSSHTANCVSGQFVCYRRSGNCMVPFCSGFDQNSSTILCP